MSATPSSPVGTPGLLRAILTVIGESLVLARRHVEHIRQIPEKLLDVTLQPIMFTLLFGYVFGSAIVIPDGNYREYMVGGVLIQTLAFGVMGPATSIATDIREGVVDRFRSLPISRSSYLIGHILAETGASLIGVVVLTVSGLILGWGIYSSVGDALAAYALIVCFAFVMVWVGTLLGLLVRSPDAAQGIVFITMFPLTFLAATFIPIGGLSPVLKAIAAWNPISTLATALRVLFGNPTALAPDAAWPLRHAVVASVAWCVIIALSSIPLAIRTFRRRTLD